VGHRVQEGQSRNGAVRLCRGHAGMSTRKMKAFGRILAALFVVTGSLYSQDKYPITRLTSDSTREGFPSWSPDGKTIVYSFFNIVEGTPVHGSLKISSNGGTPVRFTDFPTEHPQRSRHAPLPGYSVKKVCFRSLAAGHATAKASS